MSALLQKELGCNFRVESAGLWGAMGQPANDFSILLMQERDIDISEHRSRWAGDLNLAQFSHIVCVDEMVAGRVHEFFEDEPPGSIVLTANWDHGGIPDPYERGLQAYRECLALLDYVVPQVAEVIRGE